MILFWQAALKKKAGAKRPRVITKLIMPSDRILSVSDVLEIVRVETGWMKKAMVEAKIIS